MAAAAAAAAALPLLLFCSWLNLAGAQRSYSDLSTVHKAGVELALRNLGQKPAPFLYRFYSTEGLHEESFGSEVKYVHQRLNMKPTTCAKGTNDPQQTCAFREDRATMDCMVCYKVRLDQILQTPQPYVHCIMKKLVTQETHQLRRTQCDEMMVCRIGAHSIGCK